jgi:hypothetical protein
MVGSITMPVAQLKREATQENEVINHSLHIQIINVIVGCIGQADDGVSKVFSFARNI